MKNPCLKFWSVYMQETSKGFFFQGCGISWGFHGESSWDIQHNYSICLMYFSWAVRKCGTPKKQLGHWNKHSEWFDSPRFHGVPILRQTHKTKRPWDTKPTWSLLSRINQPIWKFHRFPSDHHRRGFRVSRSRFSENQSANESWECAYSIDGTSWYNRY